MRRLTALAILAGVALLPGCGDSPSTGPTAAAPLQITPEQAAAIQADDKRVADEEAGPQQAPKATKKRR